MSQNDSHATDEHTHSAPARINIREHYIADIHSKKSLKHVNYERYQSAFCAQHAHNVSAAEVSAALAAQIYILGILAYEICRGKRTELISDYKNDYKFNPHLILRPYLSVLF